MGMNTLISSNITILFFLIITDWIFNYIFNKYSLNLLLLLIYEFILLFSMSFTYSFLSIVIMNVFMKTSIFHIIKYTIIFIKYIKSLKRLFLNKAFKIQLIVSLINPYFLLKSTPLKFIVIIQIVFLCFVL